MVRHMAKAKSYECVWEECEIKIISIINYKYNNFL